MELESKAEYSQTDGPHQPVSRGDAIGQIRRLMGVINYGIQRVNGPAFEGSISFILYKKK